MRITVLKEKEYRVPAVGSPRSLLGNVLLNLELQGKNNGKSYPKYISQS